MAGLMAQADFAIGAGGTSAWERCCVGLPSAILILAGNQTLVAEALSQAGAAVILTNAAQSAKAVARIAGESGHLAAMSAAAAAVTDGQGIARVVDHILGTSGAARTVAR
jgi:spore coat polysaccharide biosynthesis predicted glycosyltransferase SpsG